MKITISQIVITIFIVDLIAVLLYPVTHDYVYFLGEIIGYFLYVFALYKHGKFKYWMPYVVGIYAPLFFHFYKQWMITLDAFIWFVAFSYLYYELRKTKDVTVMRMAVMFSAFTVMRQFGIGSWQKWTIESVVSMCLVVALALVMYRIDKKRIVKQNVPN